MKRFLGALLLACGTLLWASVALACIFQLQGQVICEGNGQPLAGVEIHVISTDSERFDATAITDANGMYSIDLQFAAACYRATPVVGASESVTVPAQGSVDFCLNSPEVPTVQNWVISSPSCTAGLCWLTAGGAKFSSITGTKLGQNGPLYSWGGNVYPGCSPTAGEGGQWNTIAHALKLHFQGWQIQVVRCGNVDGIPPGSDSPKTPFNFIEFQGTGTLKGIQGNKADYGTVHFFARCEDRNEPGAAGERDGALKDRYYLHVFSDPNNPNGTTLLLIDVDGDPATVDPLTITDGNMQIHISSCESMAARVGAGSTGLSASRVPSSKAVSAGLSFAATNPVRDAARLHFTLPAASAVSLRVFDVSGRVVRELLSDVRGAGVHAVGWDLRDATGQRIPRGIYFARLVVGAQALTRTLVVAY